MRILRPQIYWVLRNHVRTLGGNIGPMTHEAHDPSITDNDGMLGRVILWIAVSQQLQRWSDRPKLAEVDSLTSWRSRSSTARLFPAGCHLSQIRWHPTEGLGSVNLRSETAGIWQTCLELGQSVAYHRRSPSWKVHRRPERRNDC